METGFCCTHTYPEHERRGNAIWVKVKYSHLYGNWRKAKLSPVQPPPSSSRLEQVPLVVHKYLLFSSTSCCSQMPFVVRKYLSLCTRTSCC